MVKEQINEIMNKIQVLTAEIERLKAEEMAEKLNIGWIKPGIFVQFHLYDGITFYMKVTKVENNNDNEILKIYGKRIDVKYANLSTKVSYNNYGEIFLDNYVDISKIEEISEDTWDEIKKKTKEFVENFD